MKCFFKSNLLKQFMVRLMVQQSQSFIPRLSDIYLERERERETKQYREREINIIMIMSIYAFSRSH